MSRMGVMWGGRVFQCNKTGEKLTIPWYVDEGDFFSFGNCFIDVGRDGFYTRSSGGYIELVEERDNGAWMLPSWAIGRCFGELVEGAQLSTKDGRRLGNAHIIGISPEDEKVYYEVLTDAGNTVFMSEKEIDLAYYPPIYKSDVEEVKQKFKRN